MRVQEQKEYHQQKLLTMRSEKHNFIKLLKNIKSVVCDRKKELNQEKLTGVLDHIQIKIDELCQLKVGSTDKPETNIAPVKVDIRQSYDIATEHYQKEVELLRNQVSELKQSNQGLTNMIEAFKNENEKQIKALHYMRKDYYKNSNELNKVKSQIGDAQYQINIKDQLLKNSKESEETYKKQLL